MTVETWRPVVGFELTHVVSDVGNVRSLERVVTYIDGRRRQYPGCELRPRAADAAGHVKVSLSATVERYVHHLVLEAFHGPRPDGTEGLHGPAGVADNGAENVRWGTRSENNRDRTRAGTDHNRAKTQCPLDHGLDEPNVTAWARSLGHRACLACSRARSYMQDHPTADFRDVADRYYVEIMRGVLVGG